MKLALLIAAVDARVGGVLAFGDRGAGKSTAVRALAALLPKMKVVAGCRYNCDPDRPAEWCEECRTRAAKGALKSAKVPVPTSTKRAGWRILSPSRSTTFSPDAATSGRRSTR